MTRGATPAAVVVPSLSSGSANRPSNVWVRRSSKSYQRRPPVRRCSHVVIATFEPLCGKETVEVLGWQKHVFAVCG